MTVSKAEKAAVILCAAVLLFFAGWFARGVERDGYYEISGERSLPAAPAPSPDPSVFSPDVLVDLNTAALADLTGLPGVGEARAKAILDYRTEHGPFRRTEDLMNVAGIGEGVFAQLEDYITVNAPKGGSAP